MGDHRIILHTNKDALEVLQGHSGHHFEGIEDDRGVQFFDLLCDCGQLVIPIYESDPNPKEDLKVGDEVVIVSTHRPEIGKITIILDGRYAVANNSDGWERWFDRENLRKISDMKEKTCTLTWREDGTALADCSNCGEGQLYNDYNYCPNCGARNINPDGEVDIPPEAAQIGLMHPIDEEMLYCNECNKIVKNPIWDEKTHGPYCPDCKTTLVERSSDEDPKEEVPHCTLTYYDGWVLCSNCKGEWVDLPREFVNYKYCPLCAAKVIPLGEPINSKHPGTECCCPVCIAATGIRVRDSSGEIVCSNVGGEDKVPFAGEPEKPKKRWEEGLANEPMHVEEIGGEE